MQSKRNLAARMGGWSVRHRWTALGLWFAFVIAAVVGGTIAGEVDLTNAQLGDGQSGHAARVIDSAGYQKSAGEMVLVKTPSGTVRGTAGRAAIADVVKTLDGFATVRRIRNPLVADSGRISKDGRAAVITFDVLGDETAADKRIVPIMGAVQHAADRHPGLEVQEFGEASAAHVLNDKINQDFARARTVSLPLTLLILLFAFGAMVAAGVPVLLAFSAVLATFGLNSLFSHLIGHDADQPGSHPDDRHGGRRGLLAVLPPPRAGRAQASTKTADRARIREAKAERKLAKRSGDAEAVAAAQVSLKQAKAISRSNRERALDIAASTSGQAVLISGITVLIAMAGMLLAGDPCSCRSASRPCWSWPSPWSAR